MQYSNFSVEQFAADEYFIRWVSQNDQEAEKFWSLFISLHPELIPRIEQARILVLSLKHQEANIPITEHQVDIIWQGIDTRIKNASRPAIGKQLYMSRAIGIAASIAVIAILIAGIYLSQDIVTIVSKDFSGSVRAATEDFVEEVNTGEKTIRIHLSDGSLIDLAKGSRLRYREAYEGKATRDVFLAGEAFFKVAKNSEQPFLVHANEVVTKVLGTSFNVKAYSGDKEITVTVTSGKVSVFSPKNTTTAENENAEVNGVILMPNQKVTYLRNEESFQKALVEDPVVLAPIASENNFNFENTPIANVFDVLEKAYGIDVIFDEDVMKSCFITAPLSSEPLFEKLRIICKTIGANYEIMDTKVVINSSGC